MKERLEGGVVRNRAGLGRLYGLTRARITQLMNLHTLAPPLLAFLREMKPGAQAQRVTEKRLRFLSGIEHEAQLTWAKENVPGFTVPGRRGRKKMAS